MISMNKFGEWTGNTVVKKPRSYTYREYDILEKAYRYEKQRNKDLEYMIEKLELTIERLKSNS